MDLIFDLDGTLWDTSEVCTRAWNSLVKARELPIPELTQADLAGIMGFTRDEVRLRFFPDLPAETGHALLMECIHEEIRFLERTPGTLYEGVAEGIPLLAENHRLYLVSNCEVRYLEIFFEGTGLKSYFQDSECHGATGLNKAQNVARVVERNRIRTAAYVGDTLGDQRAAEKNLLPFYFVAYGFGTCTAAAERFNSFQELIDFHLVPR